MPKCRLLSLRGVMFIVVGWSCLNAATDSSAIDHQAASAGPPTASEDADLSDGKTAPVPPQVDGPTADEILASMRRGIDFLLADQNANGSWGSATRTKDLNIYAPVPDAHHAFRAATTSLAIVALLKTFERVPFENAASTSFVNGAVLVAMADAKTIGIDPPKRMVQRALAALRRQQKPDFSYLYSEDLKYQPMREINRPGGSLGRSQCCNVAYGCGETKRLLTI